VLRGAAVSVASDGGGSGGGLSFVRVGFVVAEGDGKTALHAAPDIARTVIKMVTNQIRFSTMVYSRGDGRIVTLL